MTAAASAAPGEDRDAGAAGAGRMMRSNLGWGMALVIVLAALLWAVETVRQTTPVVEVRVDLGSGVGGPAGATPARTPGPALFAVAGHRHGHGAARGGAAHAHAASGGDHRAVPHRAGR
jgi:hypothetical protein